MKHGIKVHHGIECLQLEDGRWSWEVGGWRFRWWHSPDLVNLWGGPGIDDLGGLAHVGKLADAVMFTLGMKRANEYHRRLKALLGVA
jgi:hypothetical protein